MEQHGRLVGFSVHSRTFRMQDIFMLLSPLPFLPLCLSARASQGLVYPLLLSPHLLSVEIFRYYATQSHAAPHPLRMSWGDACAYAWGVLGRLVPAPPSTSHVGKKGKPVPTPRCTLGHCYRCPLTRACWLP